MRAFPQRGLVFALTFLVTLAGVACGKEAEVNKVTSSPVGKIVFLSKGETQPATSAIYDIYTINADGSGLTRLTDGDVERFFSPTWSPDGTKIAAFAGTDRGDIYIMNADGSGLRKIAERAVDDGHEKPFAWAPDSRHLAYTQWVSHGTFAGTNDELHVVDTGRYDREGDRLEVRHLTTDYLAEDRGPSWSPDGIHIAFSRRIREIFVVNANGSDLAQLTDDEYNNYSPVWSPDGVRIAFVCQFTTANPVNEEICVMNADGAGLKRLTKSDSADEHSPIWSPDGRRIAFVSGPPNGIQSLNLINADGSGLKQLTDRMLSASQPSWSPDGNYIAYVARWMRDGTYTRDIFIIGADGSNPTNLTNTPAYDAAPAWSP